MAKRTRSQRRADRVRERETGSTGSAKASGSPASRAPRVQRAGSPRARRERPAPGKPMAMRIALGAIFVIALVLLLSMLRNS